MIFLSSKSFCPPHTQSDGLLPWLPPRSYCSFAVSAPCFLDVIVPFRSHLNVRMPRFPPYMFRCRTHTRTSSLLLFSFDMRFRWAFRCLPVFVSLSRVLRPVLVFFHHLSPIFISCIDLRTPSSRSTSVGPISVNFHSFIRFDIIIAVTLSRPQISLCRTRIMTIFQSEHAPNLTSLVRWCGSRVLSSHLTARNSLTCVPPLDYVAAFCLNETHKSAVYCRAVG